MSADPTSTPPVPPLPDTELGNVLDSSPFKQPTPSTSMPNAAAATEEAAAEPAPNPSTADARPSHSREPSAVNPLSAEPAAREGSAAAVCDNNQRQQQQQAASVPAPHTEGSLPAPEGCASAAQSLPRPTAQQQQQQGGEGNVNEANEGEGTRLTSEDSNQNYGGGHEYHHQQQQQHNAHHHHHHQQHDGSGVETFQNLFVTKLHRNIKDQDLLALFAPFGGKSATVMLDAKTGRSKGFGFVLFDTEAEGKRAHEAMHQKQITIAGCTAQLSIFPSKHDAKNAVDPSPSLYVRNVPISVPKEEVERMLEQFGSVAFCAMREEPDGLPVWVILVEYDCQQCADNALSHLRHNTALYPHGPLPVIAKYAKAMDRKRSLTSRKRQNASKNCPFRSTRFNVNGAGNSGSGPLAGGGYGGNSSFEGSYNNSMGSESMGSMWAAQMSMNQQQQQAMPMLFNQNGMPMNANPNGMMMMNVNMGGANGFHPNNNNNGGNNGGMMMMPNNGLGMGMGNGMMNPMAMNMNMNGGGVGAGPAMMVMGPNGQPMMVPANGMGGMAAGGGGAMVMLNNGGVMVPNGAMMASNGGINSMNASMGNSISNNAGFDPQQQMMMQSMGGFSNNNGGGGGMMMPQQAVMQQVMTPQGPVFVMMGADGTATAMNNNNNNAMMMSSVGSMGGASSTNTNNANSSNPMLMMSASSTSGMQQQQQGAVSPPNANGGNGTMFVFQPGTNGISQPQMMNNGAGGFGNAGGMMMAANGMMMMNGQPQGQFVFNNQMQQ